MARNPIGSAIAVGGLIATGILGMKRRKQAKDAAEHLSEAAAEPLQHDALQGGNAVCGKNVCKACGTPNTSGSATCPVCFAPMDPDR